MSYVVEREFRAQDRHNNAEPQSRRLAFVDKRYSIFSHRNTKILLVLFLLSLPLVNPWVRGDGVGYYAYVRSLMVEHTLNFESDWRAANQTFTMGRVGSDAKIYPAQYTPTGHLDNHFSVGPSILWAPFLVPLHYAMLTLQSLGLNVRPDGFSTPYVVAMAVATAIYGFLGLYLSFRLTCVYIEEKWAFLATLGIWFASSLPVYMYFNPSWSHAHSLFVVAVFLWYWHSTRQKRTAWQWVILGLISGLMLDVYYANIALLTVPLLQSVRVYWRGWRALQPDWQNIGRLFAGNLFYCLATLTTFLPTLITRQVIYGRPLEFGYPSIGPSHWFHPELLSILFSSDHGLFAWTPILILATIGLVVFGKYDREFAIYLGSSALAFYYIIACHPNWDGLSSFGNRFFISLTPLFVLGLGVLFNETANSLKRIRGALIVASSVTGLLIIWNLGFMFQWGNHLIPVRGPISWRQMAHNQVVVVPERAFTDVKAYFGKRGTLMQQIEREDIRQLQEQQAQKGR